MSIFGKIMGAIFSHPAAKVAPVPGSGATPTRITTSGKANPSPSTSSVQTVDVSAVLKSIAAQKGDSSNWKTSIVDLLKLLDLDSSLPARKELAQELNVHEGADGSAEENIALHAAVMKKLAENGGKVPPDLK